MKKFVKNILKTNKLILIPSIIFALLVIVYLSRGWIRMSVIPRSIAVVKGGEIKKTLTDEEHKLASPLALLGTANESSGRVHCFTQMAKKFHIEVRCEVSAEAFKTIPEDSDAKKVLLENTKTLQDALKQNGWSGEFDNEKGQYTSLVKLVNNLTQDIDYTPDATYTNNTGKYECQFTNVTAYSKPNPPAINSVISCGKYYSL